MQNIFHCQDLPFSLHISVALNHSKCKICSKYLCVNIKIIQLSRCCFKKRKKSFVFMDIKAIFANKNKV